MNPGWSGARKAPAVKRKPCHLGCGRQVDEYREPYGLVVRLDVHPPSVDVNLAASDNRHRIYEYHGPRIGWSPKFLPTRGWRELRLVHQCTGITTSTSRSTRRSTR